MNLTKELDALLAMVDQSVEEIVDLHQELVRIPSVNTGSMPTGDEIELCRNLDQRFRREGIASEVIETAPRRGNLLASLGTAQSPSILFMSHTDVVPAGDEARWTYPPFSAELHDGKVYGRGSDDAKSIVTSGAMTLLVLKRAGMPLRGRLVFLAAADEEAGGTYGVRWLVENVPEKVRTDYALNEGGGSPIWVNGTLGYVFDTGEKGRSVATFTATGLAAHAAQPWLGDNAIEKIAELVSRLRSYRPTLDTSLPFFEQVARLLELENPITPANVDDIADHLIETYPDLSSTIRALSRMTVSPTLITGGIKSNSIPEACSVTCDVRNLPHQPLTYVEAEMAQVVDGLGSISLKLEHTAIPSMSPADSRFVRQVKEATRLSLGRGDLAWLQAITVGFTDSRFMRSLGTEVYGFAPLAPSADPVRRAHAVDEAMEVDSLILRVKMQVALAYLLLRRASDA